MKSWSEMAPLEELHHLLDRLDPGERWRPAGSLVEAAKFGNLEDLQFFLERDPRDPAALGEALYQAAKDGNHQAVSILLAGATSLGDFEFRTSNPLVTAAAQGHLEVLRRLLALPVAGKWPTVALSAAAAAGQREAALLLLAHGADAGQDLVPLLLPPTAWKQLPPKLLVIGVDPWQSVPWTSQELKAPQVAHFHDQHELAGLLTDEPAWRAAAAELARAAPSPEPDRELLGARARLLAETVDPAVRDEAQRLLVRAAAVGSLPVVEALLARGVDPVLASKEGRTALHAAQGSAQVVAALLAAGAEVDAVDRDGKTALYLAATWGDPEVVRLLVEAGADPRRTRKKRFFPLAVAARSRHAPALEALLRRAYERSRIPAVRGLARLGSRRSGRVPPCGLGRPWRALPDCWYFVAFEDSADRVGPAVSAHFAALDLVKNVAKQRLPDGDVIFLLRFVQSSWTLMPSWPVGEPARSWLTKAEALAQALSERVDQRVCFMAADGELLSLGLFGSGQVLERHSFFAFDEVEPFQEGMRAFHRLGLYLPRCYPIRDGFDVWLELYRHRVTDVERLDVIYLPSG